MPGFSRRSTNSLVIALAALGLAAGAAAATPTPAAYRAHLNALCRTYTPSMKRAKTDLVSAQKANDAHGVGVALGRLLALGLSEDGKIEAVPVPPAMRTQMNPILSRLRAIDAHARLAIAKAAAGDGAGMGAELGAIQRLGTGLNERTDAAGLRDCGSNQS